MERMCECEAEEGQLHNWPCRREYCPFCNLAFTNGCDCVYMLLGLQSRKNSPECSHLTEEVYSEGLTDEQDEEWFKLCTNRGRIPFVYTPQMCSRCGCLWPEFFMVQDIVWFYYTTPELKDTLLCFDCFQYIRQRIDSFNSRPLWLPSNEDIDRFILAWKNKDKATLADLEPKKGFSKS